MQKYHNVAQDVAGNVISGASINVEVSSTGAPAVVYEDNETTVKGQPFTTNADGEFSFKAANGIYDIVLTNGADVTTLDEQVLFDFEDDVVFGGNVKVGDGQYYYAGDGNDLSLVHQTTYSALDNRTGSFSIRQLVNSGLLYLQSYDSVGALKTGVVVGGPIPFVKLNNDGVEVTRTTTNGLAFYNFTDITNAELLRFQGSDYGVGKPAMVFKKSGTAARYDLLAWDGVTSNVGNLTIAVGTTQFTYGVLVGSPTGGSKGAGTINAQAVYDDNVLLTDYVFDYLLDSKINKEDEKQAKDFMQNTEVLNVDYFSNFWKEHKHLPSLPSRDVWKKEGTFSIGQLAQRLWETVELQAIHIDSLNTRLKTLEAH